MKAAAGIIIKAAAGIIDNPAGGQTEAFYLVALRDGPHLIKIPYFTYYSILFVIFTYFLV